jgi:hypothetical protein
MCDFFDDFDDFKNDGFMDDDSVEDKIEEDLEMEEPLDGDSEFDNETDQPESEGDELVVDPFLIGGAMGYAFGEGMRERKRRKPKKPDDGLD